MAWDRVCRKKAVEDTDSISKRFSVVAKFVCQFHHPIKHSSSGAPVDDALENIDTYIERAFDIRIFKLSFLSDDLLISH